MTDGSECCEFLAETVPAESAAARTAEPLVRLRREVAVVAARVHRFYHRDQTVVRSWERCRFRVCRDFQRLLGTSARQEADGG